MAAIRKLDTASGRRQAGAFVVEGPQAVREALACYDDVREVYATDTARARHPELDRLAHAAGIEVIAASADVIEAMGQTQSPQGVVAICGLLPRWPLDFADRTLVVICDRASDPGNAGTIIRTADAVGADAVVLSQGSVDPHNGKAVRSSAGSMFHVPIAADVDLRAAVAAAKRAGLTVAVATGDGNTDLDTYVRSPQAVRTAWVFGSEAHGVAKEAREQADALVRIPVFGRAESLNVAAAAAVCLYATAFAQHGRLTT